jgi:hypothetical protein
MGGHHQSEKRPEPRQDSGQSRHASSCRGRRASMGAVASGKVQWREHVRSAVQGKPHKFL